MAVGQTELSPRYGARLDGLGAARQPRPSRKALVSAATTWSLPQSRVALDSQEAEEVGLARIDPLTLPPDKHLLSLLGAEFCIASGLLPWRRCGDAVIVLTARPGEVRRHMGTLNRQLGQVRMAHATESSIRAAILGLEGEGLVAEAESRVAAEESCRMVGSLVSTREIRCVLSCFLLSFFFMTLVWPIEVLAALTLWTVFWMLLGLVFKVLAFGANLMSRPPVLGLPAPDPLPVISVLVPLFHEAEIAAHLLPRLAAIDYPREALDLCLIVEDEDTTTRNALQALSLPRWVQVIHVPKGTLRTKPRALNFALPFARGSIIGIYDAEDLPHPRQLLEVATRFAQCSARTACLQGQLDYYNSEANWLARCFTLEYAAWFRVFLPGLARLGGVVPLGGTTLFVRRSALDTVGGWDAHNVTEDADLGLRLARHGYQTEVIRIVTEEEANARLWPWIRQRSRWLKGYALTWFVHMRHPRRLLRDLGWSRFLGVQVLFLGSLSQLLLAPLIWTLWLPVLGFPHPLTGFLSTGTLWVIASIFAVSTTVEIMIHVWAARVAGKQRLIGWIPTLAVYYPLATLACWRGILQILYRPFLWEKTMHGLFAPISDVTPATEPLTRPT